ncbi:hypothetical protein EDB89DRAFT_1991055, partial [Lactarius sanguifluus]
PIVMLVLTMCTSSSPLTITVPRAGPVCQSVSRRRVNHHASCISVRINTDPVNRDKGRLADIINAFQETTYISSLVTNILGTGVISLKAWRYR